MKSCKITIILLILLSLFGCGPKDGSDNSEPQEEAKTTKFNTEVDIVNEYEIPSVFAQLSEDGKINTYIDFLTDLGNKQYNAQNSAELVNKACEALYGKYEEMGSINLNKDDETYSLLYIKNDGLYYPFDIYTQYQDKAAWMDGFETDKFVYDKLSSTAEAVAKGSSDNAEVETRTIYAKAITGEVFDIDYEEFGIPIYMYDEFRVPLGLGLPKLTREEAAAINEDNEAVMISTYPDLLMYLKDRTDYYDPNSPNLQHSYILLGDYPVVKILRVDRTYESDACVIVLGNGDKCYVVDLFQKGTAAKNMKIFPIVCGMKEFENLEEVEDTFSKEFPWGGSVKSCRIEDVDAPEKIKAPNGMYLALEKRLGQTVMVYCNVQIPLGLGLPELTYEEIDELIAEKDAIKIRDSIRTLADAVCYIEHADYRMSVDLPSNNPFNAKDVGNIHYDNSDGFVYSISGAETLMIDQGQCASMSTFLHFLLRDDYDELCYIHLSAIDDGHIMIYIKNNGMYYLLNPVDYKKNLRPDGTLDDKIFHLWLQDFDDDDVVCSDSLEEMMTSLSKTTLAGAAITKVITIDYDGIIVRGHKNGTNPTVPGNYSVYPIGSTAIAWTPDSPIDYATPTHPTSQTEIIGIADYINNQ